MTEPAVPLRTLILLAQRDLQAALEYLSQPEARAISPDTPAAVIGTVGRMKLTIPLAFSLSHPGRSRTHEEPVVELDTEGKPPTTHVERVNLTGHELMVNTRLQCEAGKPHGTLEIEFITCPKE
ncbi:MAG: hypothetical protein ACM3XM_10100 [Mycobacterium leprae]